MTYSGNGHFWVRVDAMETGQGFHSYTPAPINHRLSFKKKRTMTNERETTMKKKKEKQKKNKKICLMYNVLCSFFFFFLISFFFLSSFFFLLLLLLLLSPWLAATLCSNTAASRSSGIRPRSQHRARQRRRAWSSTVLTQCRFQK